MLKFILSLCAIVGVAASCRTPSSSEVASVSPARASANGTLVIVSGQVHVLKANQWLHPFGKDMFLSDLQFYRASRDAFFVQVTDPEGARNRTHGWRQWSVSSGETTPLPTNSRDARPYRFLSSGALLLKNERFKYTEVIMQDTSGRRVEHSRSGNFLYNYVDSGVYSYIDWPSIGEEESLHFSNLVAGKQMLLKMGDRGRKETVLAAAPAILQPRFVDQGKGVCYFKPGQHLPQTEEKTFLFECVSSGGVVRPYGTVRAHVRGSRLPPVIWAFEESPYVLLHRLTSSHPQYTHAGPIEVIDTVTNEPIRRYTLGSGWMLAPQISARGAGVELEPFVVAVSRQENKARVLRLPDLSLVLETTLPSHLDRNVLKASYIPAVTR